VLRERVEVPEPELAERLTGGGVDMRRRALSERSDSTDQHVGGGIPGAGAVVGSDPQLAGLDVLEVLLFLAALDGDAELQSVRAGELRQLVAELQRVVVRV